MDKRVEAIRIKSVECVETFVCSVVFLTFKYNELLPRCYPIQGNCLRNYEEKIKNLFSDF